MQSKDYYDILGVSRSATKQVKNDREMLWQGGRGNEMDRMRHGALAW
jgi:hypothetical protein